MTCRGGKAAESVGFMLLMQDSCRLRDLQGGMQQCQQAISTSLNTSDELQQRESCIGIRGASGGLDCWPAPASLQPEPGQGALLDGCSLKYLQGVQQQSDSLHGTLCLGLQWQITPATRGNQQGSLHCRACCCCIWAVKWT